MTLKKRRKWRNSLFWSAGSSPLRAEGFSYILDVLHGGLGIDFLKAVTCYSIGHQNIASGSGSALKIIRIHNTGLKQQYLCIDISGERIIDIALIHFFAVSRLNKHQWTDARKHKIPESDMYWCQYVQYEAWLFMILYRVCYTIMIPWPSATSATSRNAKAGIVLCLIDEPTVTEGSCPGAISFLAVRLSHQLSSQLSHQLSSCLWCGLCSREKRWWKISNTNSLGAKRLIFSL